MKIKKVTGFVLILLFLINIFLICIANAADYTINYNVLNKLIEFDFGTVTATVTLPTNPRYYYRWNSSINTTGKLTIKCDTPNVLFRYCIANPCPCESCNPPFCGCLEKFMVWKTPSSKEFTESSNEYKSNINESPTTTTVTYNPRIYALISRKAITGGSDNPYSNTPKYMGPGAKTASGSGKLSVIKNESYIEKRYKYGYYTTVTNADGSTSSVWNGWYDSVNIRKSYFEQKTTEKSITVNIYNGKEKLSVIPEFKNEIENNESKSPTETKTLWWESTVMPIEVVRMMYNENSSGSLYNRKVVKGQYLRSFIEQNKAELEWNNRDELSMEKAYSPDREKAKQRNYKINDAQKAVFASDVIYQDIKFPIRSGYFFNPTGTYTFTLTTEIYKRTNGETQEHRHLVDKLIESFRYESNMVYINPATKEAVGIDNNPVIKSGTTTYPPTRRFITITPEGKSSSSLVPVTVKREYKLIVTEQLKQSYPISSIPNIDAPNYNNDIPDNVTDPKFQAVLEGYTKSGTKNSRTNYRYTEYVHENEKIFKVVETTTVTIIINPNNKKLYTHMMMKNGNYYVRALTTDINLAFNSEDEEYQLKNLRNADASGKLFGYVLDIIDIKVIGSINDDKR